MSNENIELHETFESNRPSPNDSIGNDEDFVMDIETQMYQFSIIIAFRTIHMCCLLTSFHFVAWSTIFIVLIFEYKNVDVCAKTKKSRHNFESFGNVITNYFHSSWAYACIWGLNQRLVFIGTTYNNSQLKTLSYQYLKILTTMETHALRTVAFDTWFLTAERRNLQNYRATVDGVVDHNKVI